MLISKCFEDELDGVGAKKNCSKNFFLEQKRILQFNNQNLHNTNIEHIKDYHNM